MVDDLRRRRCRNGIIHVGSPRILVTVQAERYVGSVRFMIDTGAAVSIPLPTDAHSLLRHDLFEIDFERDPRRYDVSGFSAGRTRCVVLPARYAFTTDRARLHTIRAPILVAEPTPFRPSSEGNWNRSSLLGRDLIHRFGLLLDYTNHPPVRLTFHLES